MASLGVPDALLWTWTLAAPLSASASTLYPDPACLCPAPRAGLSPGPRSSCCSCYCLASRLGALPREPLRSQCLWVWREVPLSRPPPSPFPPAAASGAWSGHAPRHPCQPGLGVRMRSLSRAVAGDVGGSSEEVKANLVAWRARERSGTVGQDRPGLRGTRGAAHEAGENDGSRGAGIW